MSQPMENESLSGGRPPPPPVQSDYQPQPASERSGYGSIEAPQVAPQAAPQVAPPNYSWYEESQRNRPQSNSLGSASMIFLSGGMSFALSVGIDPLNQYGKYVQYCWFIAVIIGACISAILAHNVKKRAFNITASLLVITKGILYTAFATNTTWIIILARYCDGIAFGLALIPAILGGSEQSVKKFRGRVLSVEQTSLAIGAMIMSLFVNGWKHYDQVNRAHGIASLCYGIIALFNSFSTTIESPIFHLRKNNETEALNVLRQLQRPGLITNETRELLNENKALLEEDLARGRTENISSSWTPLLKITILRVLLSLSFSLPITGGYLFISTLNNLPNDPNPFWFVFMRLIGVAISVIIIDNFGRKTVCAVGLPVASVFLLVVATLYPNSPAAIVTENSYNTVIAFLLIYQLLSGLVAVSSTCYLSEAFSISVKPYFILISIIVENVAQIIACTQTTFTSTSDFAYVLAGIQFMFAFMFFFTMPETKNTTLREALQMFKRTVYINLGNA